MSSSRNRSFQETGRGGFFSRSACKTPEYGEIVSTNDEDTHTHTHTQTYTHRENAPVRGRLLLPRCSSHFSFFVSPTSKRHRDKQTDRIRRRSTSVRRSNVDETRRNSYFRLARTPRVQKGDGGTKVAAGVAQREKNVQTRKHSSDNVESFAVRR